MELIDVFDKEGNKKGYSKDRFSILNEDEFALVIHIWIKNKENLYLIQQRSEFKKIDPLLWSITSGFVASGESSLKTVNRELEEELSITVDLNEVFHLKRLYPNKGYNHIVDIYLIQTEIDIDNIMLQSEEVEAIDYLTSDKILLKVKENTFYDFSKVYDDYFNYIF